MADWFGFIKLLAESQIEGLQGPKMTTVSIFKFKTSKFLKTLNVL